MANEEDKSYQGGISDALAIVISRRLGLPLGIIVGETDSRNGDEPMMQPCHAVAVLDWTVPRWIDVDGLHTGFAGANLFFVGRVDRVTIKEASEEDVLRRFSPPGQAEGQIEAAESFLDNDEKMIAAVAAAGALPKP